jgi:membrane protease YdiL (CAAX protease family)
MERLSAQAKTIRSIECGLLYFVLPPMLYMVRHQVAFRVFFVLAIAAAICAFLLLRDPGFDRRHLWRVNRPGHSLLSVLVVFVPLSLFLAVITWVLLPDKVLAFPRARPMLWLLVMLLYPPLLAWPQELYFRSFFFHRYRALFNSPVKMIVANALSFGLAHLFYSNWVAPVLSFGGGLLFAWRYHSSRSLPLVSLEHALWGDYLFTIGLGWFFYSGAIH